jgi:hypothetical protein
VDAQLLDAGPPARETQAADGFYLLSGVRPKHEGLWPEFPRAGTVSKHLQGRSEAMRHWHKPVPLSLDRRSWQIDFVVDPPNLLPLQVQELADSEGRFEECNDQPMQGRPTGRNEVRFLVIGQAAVPWKLFEQRDDGRVMLWRRTRIDL